MRVQLQRKLVIHSTGCECVGLGEGADLVTEERVVGRTVEGVRRCKLVLVHEVLCM